MDKLLGDTLNDGPACPVTPSSVPSCARATPAGDASEPTNAKTAASANSAAPKPTGGAKLVLLAKREIMRVSNWGNLT